MPELHLRLLGSPRIETGGRLVELNSRKAIALLAYLAVSAQAVSRDSLATLFWPDQDQSRARAYLRNAIYMLTQAGLEPWIVVRRETAALAPGLRLDVTEFEQPLNLIRQHDHAPDTTCAECVPQLERAAALYSGDFMDGFSLPDCLAFDEWQFFQAGRLRALLAGSLERLVHYYHGQQQPEQALPHARRWAALDALDETAQRWLMRLYALSGERSNALRQYEVLRDTLEKELGVEPDAESQQLYQEIRAQRASRESQPLAPRSTISVERGRFERPKHNLPAERTSFIGREKELGEIVAVLRPGGAEPAARLLTLTGPGGSGKTRLALKAAARLSEEFEDGVFFVDLAPVDQPERVAFAVARALGFAETPGRPMGETLIDSLKLKQLLLVLDNFEHLIPAAPLVAEILAASPGSRVLATSRELLHIYGEQSYAVLPLGLPPGEIRQPPGELLAYEAVQLFIDRAKAVQPGFEATPQALAAIAAICARLDGLPLAIELAAARLRLFSLEALHEKLSDRFGILRGGPRDLHSRQRTLRATIDWSYNLLEADEQQVFARMSVFQGDCSLEAFEQNCGQQDAPAVLDSLESLIDKSLVIPGRTPEGEPRFKMLETIHEYAREKLEEFGETQIISERHARYFAQMAAEAEPHLRGGSKLLLWLQRMEREHGNLRAALDWCLSGGDPHLGMEMAGSLTFFWVRQDHHSEGRAYLDQALRGSADAPAAIRAKLYLAIGVMAYFREELADSLAAHQQAVSLYRQIGDPASLGWSLTFYGGTLGMVYPEQYAEALAVCEEALDILRKTGDQPRIAQALNFIGEVARTHGDYEVARAVYEECLILSREIGDRLRELMIDNNLVYVALRDQDYARAETLAREGIQLAFEINSVSQLASIFMAQAGLSAARHNPRKGALMVGAAKALLDSSGLVLQPADTYEVVQYQSALRERLGEREYQQAVDEGRQMPIEDVIALALE